MQERERSSSYGRISRPLVKCREAFRRRCGSSSGVSSPRSRISSPSSLGSVTSNFELATANSISASLSEFRRRANATTIQRSEDGAKALVLRANEIRLISQSLNRALKEADFGKEIVARLLNNKRHLFKSMLANCAPQAHEILVFDVQSLVRYCPRSVQVGDGITRFFKRMALLLKEDIAVQELEEKLGQMCQDNGKLHYRMRVWFQAENWLCMKHSIVDAVLSANSQLKQNLLLKSASDLPLCKRCLRLPEAMDAHQQMTSSRLSVEVVWMKMAQMIINWMKHGFLEAALGGKEEQDQQL